MRLLIALLLPWLTFFTIGRPFAGILCLLLQITIIGWLPATIWAVYALGQYKTNKKIAKALSARPKNNAHPRCAGYRESSHRLHFFIPKRETRLCHHLGWRGQSTRL